MSQAFPEAPQLEPLPDGRRWRVLKDFYFYGKSRVVKVPAGTVCDFASTPRWIWWLLPPWGKYGRAAIAHDHDYQEQGVTKEVADATFYEGMRSSGVGRVRAKVIFWSVALFGGRAWRSHQHRKKKDGEY